MRKKKGIRYYMYNFYSGMRVDIRVWGKGREDAIKKATGYYKSLIKDIKSGKIKPKKIKDIKPIWDKF